MRFWAILFNLSVLLTAFSLPLSAQDKSWLQVETLPDLATAEDRARAYSALFPNVEGYQVGTWYAIAIGPMTRAEAGQELLQLRSENLIPSDSYIADGKNYGRQFWPQGATAPDPDPDPEAQAAAPEVPEPAPDETLAESREAEAALSKDEKMALQQALAWFGYYEGGIDGAFGKGTRASFAAWQTTFGYEATGVLSTAQRQRLLNDEATEKSAFGFDLITETESGIEVTLPMALVAFEGYEPPFAQFGPRDSLGPRLMLISEPGDRASLAGMYDLLQSLEIVPMAGERRLDEAEFLIRANSDTVSTYAWAASSGGQIKGFLLSWTPENADKMSRIIDVAMASFRSLGDKTLDPGLVPLDDAARQGLLTGLAPRKPKFSRSGFYVSSQGAVLTKSADLDTCKSITLDGGIHATLSARDPVSGVALLTPEKALSPRELAGFATASPRKGAEIVVAGYSYGDKLPAPVLTFGRLDETSGLAGEAEVSRLTAPVLPGDQGGPVLSNEGAVLGLLTGPGDDPSRVLPPGVVFSANSVALSRFLTAQGITPRLFDGKAQPPDALSRSALGMTLRVDCWQ